MNWRNHPAVAVWLVFLVYGVFAYIYAQVKPFWCDERWAQLPAYNLAFNGFFGLHPERSDCMVWGHYSEWYTYYMPPLSYWSMAVWFFVTRQGGEMATRMHSVLWGCVLLAGIVRMVWEKRTASDSSWQWAGVWAALLAAVNFHFLSTSDGRPDMMCAALGIWGLIKRSHWLTAAAGMVHPVGLIYGLILMSWERRVVWLPYVVAFGVWGIYIVQAPGVWLDQWGNNVYDHLTMVQQTKGLAVYMGFGERWRLLVLAAYVWCGARVALRDVKMAWWLGIVVLFTWFMTRSINYAPHFVALFSLVVAMEWKNKPWLMAGLFALELVFAVTTLFPLWRWDGIFTLR